MGQQSGQHNELLSAVHLFRIQAHSMHHKVQPLICGKVLPLVNELLYIYIGYLDRLQSLDIPPDSDIFSLQVTNSHNTPNTVSGQQFRVGSYKICSYRHMGKSKIGKFRLINIQPLIQSCCYLINDTILTCIFDFSLHCLGFSTVYIVILNNLFHLLQSALNGLFIISSTVLAKQVLKHVSRDGQTALNLECQILSHNLA